MKIGDFEVLCWLLCGAVTVTLLILSAHKGRRLDYAESHEGLLMLAFGLGPVGWLVAVALGFAGWILVRIGNHGGFQEL